MKRFNEHLQEKLNSFEYPYEEGTWEAFKHKMLIRKIVRWATAFFVTATAITTIVLISTDKEMKTTLCKETKNNVVTQTNIEKEKSIISNQNPQPNNEKVVAIPEKLDGLENNNDSVKKTEETEINNNVSVIDVQNNNVVLPASISFNKDKTKGCAPLQVGFNSSVNVKILNFVWDFGDGTTSFEQNPVHVYKKGGKYNVVLTVKTYEGKTIVSEQQQIHVFNKPKAIIDFNIDDNCVDLQNVSKQSFFKNWYFNDSLLNDENARICIKKSGMYNVSLIVENNEGCSDSTTQKISLTYKMPIKFAEAFTPDGDGINDLFGPIVADYSQYEFRMFVYKKEGKCVFEHIGSPVNWDGYDQNTKQPCPDDIYFYKVIAVDKLGNKNEFSGKIVLKR